MREISRQQDEFLFGRSIDDYTEYEEFFAAELTVHSFDQRYILEVAVPGFHSHELSLSVDRDLLILKGFKEEGMEAVQNRKVKEHRVAVFQRTCVLPNDVGINTISANYQPGLVHITCPRQLISTQHHKHFLVQRRKIKITSGTQEGRSWWSKLTSFFNRLLKR